MYGAFDRATAFTGKGLYKWNLSSVTNLEYAFWSTTLFDTNVSNWDVSSVETMKSMFLSAEAFQGKGVEQWNVSAVTNM